MNSSVHIQFQKVGVQEFQIHANQIQANISNQSVVKIELSNFQVKFQIQYQRRTNAQIVDIMFSNPIIQFRGFQFQVQFRNPGFSRQKSPIKIEGGTTSVWKSLYMNWLPRAIVQTRGPAPIHVSRSHALTSQWRSRAFHVRYSRACTLVYFLSLEKKESSKERNVEDPTSGGSER